MCTPNARSAGPQCTPAIQRKGTEETVTWGELELGAYNHCRQRAVNFLESTTE